MHMYMYMYMYNELCTMLYMYSTYNVHMCIYCMYTYMCLFGSVACLQLMYLVSCMQHVTLTQRPWGAAEEEGHYFVTRT